MENKIKDDRSVKLPDFKVDVQLIRSGANTDWSHDFYKIEQLHATGRKGKNVKVAVLDTGVDLSHDSFKTAIETGRLKAVDARRSKNEPFDLNGHGTWCASRFISNGDSVLGFAPDCTLTSYKVLNDNGSGSLSDVVRGLEMAVKDGAQIISTSLGWPGPDVQSIHDMAKEIQKLGIIWVSAAGNDGTREDIDYPAIYDEIISAGSHDKDRTRSFFSDFGVDLDLYSSGNEVLGAYTGNREAYLRGTSMATPSLGALIATIYDDLIKHYGGINREVLKTIATCL